MPVAIPTIVVFPEEKLTLNQKIEKWVWQYCRSLEENYKQHSIRMFQGSDSDYSKKRLEDVNNGTANLAKFRMEFGRKYIKIMEQYIFDNMMEYFSKLTVDELEEEVYNHDEELWEELVDNVTQQYPKLPNTFGGQS